MTPRPAGGFDDLAGLLITYAARRGNHETAAAMIDTRPELMGEIGPVLWARFGIGHPEQVPALKAGLSPAAARLVELAGL
jgi:hypothetical protein